MASKDFGSFSASPTPEPIKMKQKLYYKWQWQNDSVWIDYIDNEDIEDTYQDGGNEYQFLVGNKRYEIRFNRMTQCNLDTGFERVVRRIALDENGIQVAIPPTERRKKKVKPIPPKSRRTGRMNVLSQYKWQWESPQGWRDYDQDVSDILNSLDIGEVVTLQFSEWEYEISKVNDTVAMQRNKQTDKIRNARAIRKDEYPEDATPEPQRTPEPEFKIDDEQNLKEINEMYHKEILNATQVFETAIFDPEVYSFIPNSPEHLLQIFNPESVLQPTDVSMFLCATMNRLIRHCSDSTPLPPLSHAIYYAKKKRRKEIGEEIEKLKKSRVQTEENKEDEKNKQESDEEKKKRKQAKECINKFFKIFDIAHNGDLDINEFKKGCQIINLQWTTLFREVQLKREEEKRRLEKEKIQKANEEKLQRRPEKLRRFHEEILAERQRMKKMKDKKKKKLNQNQTKPDDKNDDDKDKKDEDDDDDDKPQEVKIEVGTKFAMSTVYYNVVSMDENLKCQQIEDLRDDEFPNEIVLEKNQFNHVTVLSEEEYQAALNKSSESTEEQKEDKAEEKPESEKSEKSEKQADGDVEQKDKNDKEKEKPTAESQPESADDKPKDIDDKPVDIDNVQKESKSDDKPEAAADAPKPEEKEDKVADDKPKEEPKSDDKESKVDEEKPKEVEPKQEDKPKEAEPKVDDKSEPEPEAKPEPKKQEDDKPADTQDKPKEDEPKKEDDKPKDDKAEELKPEDKDKDKDKTKDDEQDKPKEEKPEEPELKPIEYPTKEDDQLRYIYQTTKPSKDADRYLNPKHFQDFLLNESRELKNDPVMLLFRERIKQTIKFHKIPNGAWQGWYTEGKDYSSVDDILKTLAEGKLSIPVDELMKKSGFEFEKKESNFEMNIDTRVLKDQDVMEMVVLVLLEHLKEPIGHHIMLQNLNLINNIQVNIQLNIMDIYTMIYQ